MTLTEKGVVFVFLYWMNVRNATPWEGTSRSISISGFYMTEKNFKVVKKSVKTSKIRQTGQSEGRFRRCRPLKKSDKKQKWSLVSKTKDGEQNDWKTTPHTKHETQNEPRGARNFVAQRR